MKMFNRIEMRMKREPGIYYVTPPCRLGGIASPDQLIFSDVPTEADDADAAGMAEEVGITDDATIAQYAAEGIDDPPGEAAALAAKAGAAEPPAEREEPEA